MKSCEIHVVNPVSQDLESLTETFRRLGYLVADDGDIVVVDARESSAAEWAMIERDLASSRHRPTVVISDDDDTAVVSLAQQLGPSVVFTNGGSDVGYAVAVKLCTLLLDEQEVAA